MQTSQTRRFESHAQLSIVVTLIVASYLLFKPFIGATVWGGIIAISLWPVYRRLDQALHGRHALAASLLGVVLALLLVIPLIMLGLSMVSGVTWLINQPFDLDDLVHAPPPAWLSGLPVVGEYAQRGWENTITHLSESLKQIAPFLRDTELWLLKKGTGAGMAALQFVIAIVVAMVLLARHQACIDFTQRLAARISPHRGKYLLDQAQKTIRGVSMGVMGTAFAQAALTALGLLVAGVPAATALGFATFLIAIIQLPTFLVWAPAAVWLYSTGDGFWSGVLAGWGLLVVNTIDNFLKPYLISQGASLPLALIFIGVIGGLLAWGFVGLFIGPTILAMSYTLLLDWLYQEPTAGLSPQQPDSL